MEILFQEVSFTYEEAATRLFDGLTPHFPSGWTGIVGANGAGKTTILRLATGGLAPEQGQVQTTAEAIYCPQQTDDPPHLIVMDEPTNHLDLPSIECLEEALDQCPCGLLLVSHDFRFLERLTDRRWQLREVETGDMELSVEDGWK